MKSIILCEGKTDIILLSYYLNKMCGWESLAKREFKVKRKQLENRLSTMQIVNSDNQAFEWYFNDKDDILCIYAVGDNTSFSQGIQQIIDINLFSSSEAFDKVVVISDRDDESAEDKIIKDILNTFNANNGFFKTIVHNQWNTSNEYTNMGNLQRIYLLPIILPLDETGTMETFLLNCRKEIHASERRLIENCNDFVDQMDEDEYIHTNYLRQRGIRPKAKLSVYWSIVSPNRTFDTGNIILSSIPWEKYSNFTDTFRLLEKI